jgi:hypothetical protein
VRFFFVGFLMLLGGFRLFELAELRGIEIAQARTLAVNVFVIKEITNETYFEYYSIEPAGYNFCKPNASAAIHYPGRRAGCTGFSDGYRR